MKTEPPKKIFEAEKSHNWTPQKRKKQFLKQNWRDSLSNIKKYDLWYESEKKIQSAIELSMLEEFKLLCKLWWCSTLCETKTVKPMHFLQKTSNWKSSRNRHHFQDFALIFRIPEKKKRKHHIYKDDSTNIVNLKLAVEINIQNCQSQCFLWPP